MSKKITTIKGLLGQLIHYEGSKRVGESWPGLFKGSYEHYDDNGYAGYSDPGIVADLVHRDSHGAYVGKTYNGLFGQKHHYSADGYIGSSWDAVFGEITDLWRTCEADADISDCVPDGDSVDV